MRTLHFKHVDVFTSTPLQGNGLVVFPDAADLTDEEMQWLDAQCTEIKINGWRGVTRSSFIRALVRVAMEQKTDVKGVSGEVELIARLTPHS